MAVPAHDQRDYDFAKAFNLPIVQVLAGGEITVKAHEEDGAHINSGYLTDENKEEGMRAASITRLKTISASPKSITNCVTGSSPPALLG